MSGCDGRGLGVRRGSRVVMQIRWLNVRQPMTPWSGVQNRFWSKKCAKIGVFFQNFC